MKIEPGKMYIGRIVPGMDNKQKGGYQVHIPDILPHTPETNGLYCKNGIHPYHVTKSDAGVYGSSFPLHPGTVVGVIFSSTDLNSGRISAIISDTEDMSDFDARTGKEKGALEDRDEEYILLVTPKYKNVIQVNENSSVEPNQIYVTFNNLRTSIKITEDGILITSKDNKRTRLLQNKEEQIDLDYNTVVGQNFSLSIKGNCNIKVDGNTNIESSGDLNLKAGGNMNIEGGGTVNIRGDSAKYGGGSVDIKAEKTPVNITGNGGVNLSSGASSAGGAGGSSPTVPNIPEIGPA